MTEQNPGEGQHPDTVETRVGTGGVGSTQGSGDMLVQRERHQDVQASIWRLKHYSYTETMMYNFVDLHGENTEGSRAT